MQFNEQVTAYPNWKLLIAMAQMRVAASKT
jgi:hypothetical protein